MKIGAAGARPLTTYQPTDVQDPASAVGAGQVSGPGEAQDLAPTAQPAGVAEINSDGYDPGQLRTEDVAGLADAPVQDLLKLDDDNEAAALPPEIDPSRQDSRVDDFTRRVTGSDASVETGAKKGNLFGDMMKMIDEESDISNPLKGLAEK